MSAGWYCATCGGRCIHVAPPDPGADAGKSDASADPPSSDAAELAREVIANDARDTRSLTSLTLAAAVIAAQAEELVKLRVIAWTCPRCGRDDLQAQHAIEHRTSCMSRTDEQRIDELRAALAEACEIALNIELHPQQDAMCARIAELRRMTNGG